MFRKLQKHIQKGTLKEVMRETAWIYGYMRSYRRATFAYILLGLLGTGIGLQGAV